MKYRVTLHSAGEHTVLGDFKEYWEAKKFKFTYQFYFLQKGERLTMKKVFR